MRISTLITSNTGTITIPRENPNECGGQWKTFKIIKIYNNVDMVNYVTNKCLILKIDQLNNNQFIKTTGGELLEYTHNYFLSEHSTVEELKHYSDSLSAVIKFKDDRKTNNLTFSIYNIVGDLYSILSSSYYLIIEFELL